MTEATQTANSNDARQASMSRVETQETILAKLNPTPDAKDPAETTQESNKEEGKAKPPKTAQERIQELAGKRKEAEAKAEAAERRAAELEARLQSLSVNAKPLEAGDKPLRSQYTTDDDYIEAVTDWKARQTIAKREQEQAQARMEAEQAEIAAQWSKRQEAVMKSLPDYADVIGKTEVSVPNHIHTAILESEMGPQVAYYLALNPDEAKRLAQMRPAAGILRVAALARDLADVEEEEVVSKEDKPPVQQSKAPKPIEPVRGVPSGSSAGTTDFESYRARRKAQQAEQRR